MMLLDKKHILNEIYSDKVNRNIPHKRCFIQLWSGPNKLDYVTSVPTNNIPNCIKYKDSFYGPQYEYINYLEDYCECSSQVINDKFEQSKMLRVGLDAQAKTKLKKKKKQIKKKR